MKSIKNIVVVILLVSNLGFLIYVFYQHKLKTKAESEIADCHSELIMAKKKVQMAQEMAEQQMMLAEVARARAEAAMKKANTDK